MRFIHTADLHLGKRLHDVPLLEDQIYMLDELRKLAIARGADAVMIAGDVYQSSSPPSEAMSAFDGFVTALAAAGIRVFAVSGNHDSERRVAYLASLVRGSGIYVSERFTGTLQQFTMEDEHGKLVVSLLPFIKPINVRRCYPEETIESYQDAAAAVLRHSPVDTAKRNILICHQFITGAQTAGSEELSVGGVENIDAALFKDFDYVALGHIHRAQRVGRETMRYAGSPLKYSLAEAAHKKSAAVVDMGAKGDVKIELVPLTPLHDVREVEGYLDGIMRMPYSEDYVRVTVRDELVPPDARVTVTTVFPNLLRFEVRNSKTGEAAETSDAQDVEDKSVEELFRDFFSLQNNGAQPDEEQLALIREVLRESGEAEK